MKYSLANSYNTVG